MVKYKTIISSIILTMILLIMLLGLSNILMTKTCVDKSFRKTFYSKLDVEDNWIFTTYEISTINVFSKDTLYDLNEYYNSIVIELSENNKQKIVEEQEAAYKLQQAKNKEAKHYSEYYAASYVWYFLKNCGFNDYVCAGILGNMMVECGGWTLNLHYSIYDASGNYYGLCQWVNTWCAEVHGQSLDGQLRYLVRTMKPEISQFAYKYYSGFSYSKFCNLQNERDAALAFAQCYEKCKGNTYTLRQDCATIALRYFTK